MRNFQPRDTVFTERAIIAAIAFRPINLKKLVLGEDDFKNSYNREIFRQTAILVNEGDVRTAEEGFLTALGARLSHECQQFFRSLVDDPLVEVGVKVEVLQKELRKIQAENIVGEIVARNNITDPELIRSLIEQKQKELASVDLKTGKELGLETYRELEKLQELKGALSGIPSGIAALDEYTHGFQNSALYIIAGRTSMGKSAVLANLFLAAMRAGKNPVFVTLEESDKSLAMRLITILSGVSAEKARSSELTPDEWKSASSATDELGEMNPHILQAHGFTADKIAAQVNAVNNSQRVGMVLIDHLHEISAGDSGKFESEPAKIGKTMQALRKLCVSLNVPLILAAQINREVEGRDNKRPGMGNLKGSGSIEQVADMVLILYRQSYYDGARPDLDTIEINVAKNRNGRTGMAKVGFLPRSLALMDWSESCYQGGGDEAGRTNEAVSAMGRAKSYRPYQSVRTYQRSSHED